LRSRIGLALGDTRDDDVAETERVCLDAAERVLSGLVGQGTGDRGEAVDLLAADALVTYALEFAADGPDGFGDRATRAMERFGQLREERG
jgi:hypothetical protein